MQLQAFCLKYVSTHVEEVSLLRVAVPRDGSGADKESDCGITVTNYFICLSEDTKESFNSESGPVLKTLIVGSVVVEMLTYKTLQKANGRIDMVKATETFLLFKKRNWFCSFIGKKFTQNAESCNNKGLNRVTMHDINIFSVEPLRSGSGTSNIKAHTTIPGELQGYLGTQTN
uniref:Uncharacterized protein n=1 Tax=Glossina palpalis gambiensis TaxID=67801 RepID=A0A1B0BTN7_9MUSC